MKLLVIGHGSREHALAWRLAQSPNVRKVYVAPGNDGIKLSSKLSKVPYSGIKEIAGFAKHEKVAFTVVGAEAPLAAGIVDVFRACNLKIFGPTSAASQLESSKYYAKNFMARHGIPTARYRAFTDPSSAHKYIERAQDLLVIKEDGLASGKGVVVTENQEEAHKAVKTIFSEAGPKISERRILVEERLSGKEISFTVMCDGNNILSLATSQDYKRLRDNNLGPNTGGMGAYSPVPMVSSELHQRIINEVVLPTIQGMASENTPYTGFLYVGLMIGPGKDIDRPIHVLEYNCRLGDPETQCIMVRLENDLVDIFEHAIHGTLYKTKAVWKKQVSISIVLAAQNYPNIPRTGDIVTGISKKINKDCMVFYSGLRIEDNVIYTTGGRVLCITALGDSFTAAREIAYWELSRIKFFGCHYRHDIGLHVIGESPQNFVTNSL